MSRIRCVLIDDEPKALQLLKIYCEQLEHQCVVVATYPNADKFLSEHERISYDLLMLDIDMDGLKGTDLARVLSQKAVVFVTGQKDFDKEVLDLQLYQNNIIALIRKPADKETIEIAFNKYLSLRPKRAHVVFNTNKGSRNIQLADILLITTKADGFKQGALAKHHIEEKFHGRNKILVSKSELLQINLTDFDALEELLPPDDFVMINRSTMVSRKAIWGYDSDGISFVPELRAYISTPQFNVSDDYIKAFRSWFRR